MHDILQQILYFFGHGFCHQFPERSLEAGGLYFSVCARCTGIYLGFILTLVIIFILAKITRGREAPAAMPPAWAIAVGGILIVPMAIDGVGSYTGIYVTTNLLRFITGYLCGMGVAVITSGGILSLLARPNHSLRAIDKPGKLVLVVVISAVLGALFYITYGFMGAVAPFLVLVCLWFSVTLVILLILSTTKFWPTGAPARRRVVLVVVSLLAALAVLSILSLLTSLFGFLFPWYVHP